MKKLIYFLSLAMLIVACSDSDNGGGDVKLPIEGLQLPATESIIPGETVTIQGKGFNSTSEIWFKSASGNVKATIVSVTENGVEFEVPEVYGSQAINLKQDGQTYLLGKVELAEKQASVYAYKRNWADDNNYLTQIYKIDPKTGDETLVSDLDIPGTYYDDLVFSPLTNEIIGCIGGQKLLKVNVDTGVYSESALSTGYYYSGLLCTSAGKLYAHRSSDDTNKGEIVEITTNGALVKVVTTFDFNYGYFEYMTLNESTGEIYGIARNMENFLVKINVANGTYSTVNLDDDSSYYGMVYCNGKLYAAKNGDTNYLIVSINLSSGAETLVAQLDSTISSLDYLVCNAASNEVMFVGNRNTLKSVNVKTGEIKSTQLDSSGSLDYDGLVIKN